MQHIALETLQLLGIAVHVFARVREENLSLLDMEPGIPQLSQSCPKPPLARASFLLLGQRGDAPVFRDTVVVTDDVVR